MLDLLGQPVSFPQTSAAEQAARLYELGDRCLVGSVAREEYFRRAAIAQQQAEAGKQVAADCERRRQSQSRDGVAQARNPDDWY